MFHALSWFIPERLLSTEGQFVAAVHFDCILQYSHGFHGHTQYIQCVYHPLCDVADHYSCVPRFKDRFPDTRHHDINMLHIPTLPAWIYPDPVGGGTGCDIQFKGIIPKIPTFPDGAISHIDLCRHLLCLRVNDGERAFQWLLETEFADVHLFYNKWSSAIIRLSAVVPVRKNIRIYLQCHFGGTIEYQ